MELTCFILLTLWLKEAWRDEGCQPIEAKQLWARCSGPVLLAKTRTPETPADAAHEAQARLSVELPLLAAHQARLKTRLEA